MGKLHQVLWEFGTKAKASAVTVRCADLNAGNFVAQEGLRDDFLAAVTAVSLGNLGSMDWAAASTEVARTPASAEAAQRENKWLVSFVDSAGNGGNFTIPCYDSALLGPDGEEMETGTPRTNLINATEAFVKSKAGNTVTVTSIKFTSRNL